MTQQSPGQPEEPRYAHHHRSEKEEEKENEKGRGEKNWDEKWRRDPVNAVSWAAIFIWAGLCLFAENTGWGPDTFSWWQTWAVIMGGAGAIFIVAALIRLAVPEHRRPITGGLILGFILMGVGLGELTGWGFGILGAFILIAIGLIIILRGLIRRRQ
jgi:hypothetical protein